MTTPVAQALLDEIEAKRGYVLDMHRVLAEHDPDFLRGYETLIDAAYARDGALDRRTQEFVYVAALVALSAPRPQVVAHMEAALEAGATTEELLQVVEQLMPLSGRRGSSRASRRGAKRVEGTARELRDRRGPVEEAADGEAENAEEGFGGVGQP